MKIADIIQAVAEVSGLEAGHVLSPRQSAKISTAKHLARWMAHDLLSDQSFPALGKAFKKDHSTIIHSVRVAERRLETEDGFRALYMRAMCRLAEGSEVLVKDTEQKKTPTYRNQEMKPKFIGDPKKRKCLGFCGQEFDSEWNGERICKRCKDTAAWRSGAVDDWQVLDRRKAGL